MSDAAGTTAGFLPRLVNADWNFWPDGLDRPAIWQACADLGFAAMEVGVYRPRDELSSAAMDELATLARRSGLGVHAVLFSMPPERWPAGGLAIKGESERAVADLVETARRAADLGAQVLGLWPGADPPEHDGDAPGDGWKRTLDAVEAVAASAGPLGLAVAVEYKPGQLVAGAEHALRLASATGRAGVGVLVDTAHALAGGEDLASLAGQLGDRLVHVHLGDSEGDTDADLPPGAVHDFAPFLTGLAAAGYGGALSFDLYGSVQDGVATGTEASSQGIAHIRGALERAGS